jgi:hypothetical protein
MKIRLNRDEIAHAIELYVRGEVLRSPEDSGNGVRLRIVEEQVPSALSVEVDIEFNEGDS